VEVVEVGAGDLAEEEGDVSGDRGRAGGVGGGVLALHAALLVESAASRALKRGCAALEFAKVVALDLARRLIEIVGG
jgi:hypothetical protein